MRLAFIFITLLSSGPLAAAGYNRPIPQAQSATAELWFAIGSIALIAALVAVGALVARR